MGKFSVKEIFKNLILNFFSYALPTVVLQFVVQPIIARKLGADLNGQYLTLMSLNYFMIGITAAVLNTVRMLQNEKYEQQKQRMADDCIRLAEKVIPDLRDMVETCYTSTPLTWRDYTLSPCGSAFGIRKDCRQPLLTMLSPKTPVPNLFLTGQSLVLHGLEGVTMTAFKTLETIKNEKI
jgi:hypothetical protein